MELNATDFSGPFYSFSLKIWIYYKNSVTSIPFEMIDIFLIGSVVSSMNTLALDTFLWVQMYKGISTGLQKSQLRLGTRAPPVSSLAVFLSSRSSDYFHAGVRSLSLLDCRRFLAENDISTCLK